MAISVTQCTDVTLEQLHMDPYPIYERFRKDSPVVWLDCANIHLVTRADDIKRIESDHETFPALDLRSLQIRAMGHSLMRRDGHDHSRQRKALEPTFSPKTVKEYWADVFETVADELIDKLYEKGEADIFTDFGAPMASLCLKHILGMPQVDWKDLCVWSQALIDATGNYGDDPDVWSRGKKAYDAVDHAIEDVLQGLREKPNHSALSSLIHADDALAMEDIRANIKIIIGGGLNEPRDALCTELLALLQNPDQLAQINNNPSLWRTAFEESVRWIAPIGMYPRRVSRRVEIGGAILDAGDAIGLSVASACHDEDYFEAGHLYNINRKRASHLGFGNGPHFCLGTWISRMMVGQIAVPKLFDRLPNLRLDENRAAIVKGWVFRGPTSLPVKWDI